MVSELRLRRRTRPLLGVSGAVLFACMFLPATHVCGNATYPLEEPFFIPPYLVGLALAIIAIARSRAVFGAGVWLLRITMLAVTLETLVWLYEEPSSGIVAVTIALTIQGALGIKQIVERRIAIATIGIAVVMSVWFFMVASPPDGMIGGELSFGASIALLIAAIMWTSDARPPPEPPELPRAIVR